MDIAASLSVNAINAVRTEASFKVAALAMNSLEQNSAALIELMEKSVNPYVGGTIDIKL